MAALSRLDNVVSDWRLTPQDDVAQKLHNTIMRSKTPAMVPSKSCFECMTEMQKNMASPKPNLAAGMLV